jgi:hypothetical protein
MFLSITWEQFTNNLLISQNSFNFKSKIQFLRNLIIAQKKAGARLDAPAFRKFISEYYIFLMEDVLLSSLISTSRPELFLYLMFDTPVLDRIAFLVALTEQLAVPDVETSAVSTVRFEALRLDAPEASVRRDFASPERLIFVAPDASTNMFSKVPFARDSPLRRHPCSILRH